MPTPPGEPPGPHESHSALEASCPEAHAFQQQDADDGTGTSRWLILVVSLLLAVAMVSSLSGCLATGGVPSPGMAPIALLFLSVALRQYSIEAGVNPRRTAERYAREHAADQEGETASQAEFTPPRSLSILSAELPGQGPVDLVTWLPAQWRTTNILSPEHILGRLVRPRREGGTLRPDNFVPHETFVQFLHEFLARELPGRPGLRMAARRQNTGWVFFVDMRVLDAPRSRRPREGLPEDVVGAFRVRDGSIVPGSYRPNPAHLLLSAKGLFQLEYAVQARLKQEVAARHAFRRAGQPTSEFVM